MESRPRTKFASKKKQKSSNNKIAYDIYLRSLSYDNPGILTLRRWSKPNCTVPYAHMTVDTFPLCSDAKFIYFVFFVSLPVNQQLALTCAFQRIGFLPASFSTRARKSCVFDLSLSIPYESLTVAILTHYHMKPILHTHTVRTESRIECCLLLLLPYICPYTCIEYIYFFFKKLRSQSCKLN